MWKDATQRTTFLRQLVGLLKDSGLEVLDYEEENENEWGFVEVLNEKNQQVTVVVDDSRLGATVLVDGVEVKNGTH
jgi:hypothetical protein